MDIGQGAGLATTSGVRPVIPVIVVGVLANADAGTDFSGTDWSWMESWIWLALLAVLFVGGWIGDRSREKRPEDDAVGYGLISAAMGALAFAASLAAGGNAGWPGIAAGAVLGFIGYLALARLFARATKRLNAAGDSGTLLGIGRDLIAVAASVAIVFADVLGFLAVLTALALLVLARRRGDEKYEGLRILR